MDVNDRVFQVNGTPVNGVPDQAIDELFLKLIAKFKAHGRACAEELDLSLLQLIALRHLGEPLPMGRLADVLFSDPSVITSVADGLEARGYVERRVSESDRRVKELVLTPEGRDAKRRVRELMARDNPAFAPLDAAERATFVELLRKMTADVADG